MKIRQVLDFDTIPVSLRSACDISRACRPICMSPISPSSSARGTSAATESMTITSMAALRTSTSAISNACSPLSGCETIRLSMSTPSFFAYSASRACSASMNAASPPVIWASAMMCSDSVVLPDDSGPKISMILPRGTIIEIFGPESSGKTTLSLHIIAEAQMTGGLAAFIDAEHALDAEYAKKLGVDVDNLLVSQPDSGEQGLEIAEVLVRSGAIDVIVIDSVAALVPRAELEGEMGEAQMGLQARLMSQALRKLTGIVSKSKTCLIFINQIREKIGVMFGNPETTTGGRALKFYASVRVDVRRTNQIKEGDEVTGSRTKAKIVKNKVAPPFREAEFDIMYGVGISREGDMLDLAVEKNIIDKSGAWFSFQGERLGQGRENARQFLRENIDIKKKLEVEVRKVLNLPVPQSSAAPDGTAAGRAKK